MGYTRSVCFCLGLLLAGPANSWAQVLYGSIVGNVRDASGASVPEATVTITNKETGASRTTTTNDEGSYSIPTVQSGTYRVAVTHAGFRAAEQSNLAVTINNVSRADFTIEVGAVSEAVMVTASTQVLQTDRAEVRSEMTTKTLTDVPVPGQRNYQALFITIPGITPPSTPHSIPSNPSRSMQWNTNGVNSAANNTRIDGASATNVWLPHIASYVPALESIETVNIVTNSFDAEQGLAGGAAVNVQIRSGSNEIHGAGFWYHMGNWSQSRPYFQPAGQDIPKFVYNQNGGRIGGPILKNRIFYFGSYEGTYDRRFAARTVTVPTAAMRTGDLSASSTTIYDPLTGNPDGTGRTPFAGNVIPADRIHPLSTQLMNLLPLPNVPGVLTANYYAGAPFNFDRHTVDSKFNFNLTDKWTSFARLSYLRFNTFNQTTFGDAIGGQGINNASNPGTGYGHTWTGTLGTTYAITPALIVDAYYGYTLMDANVEQPGLGPNTGRDVWNIPGTNGTRRFESGMPRIDIGGFEPFGSTESFMPYFRHDPQQQYVANVNWTKGTHNFRFGMDLYRLALNHTQPEFSNALDVSAAGRLNFRQGPTQLSSGSTTSRGSDFNSMASFLLGYVYEGGRLLQVPDEYATRTGMYSFYARDQWQVTRNLTVDYGTRYEYFPMPTRGDRGMERYDFATNSMLICGVGSVPKDCGTKVGKAYFSPRIGLAYRLGEKTVLRSGFGINWDPWNLARPLRTNYPVLVVLNQTAPNSLAWATTFSQGLQDIPVPDLGNGVIPVPKNYAVTTTGDSFSRAYILNWNFTIQRELPGNFSAQAGYVANRAVHTAGVLDLNAGQVPGLDNAGRPFFGTFGRTAATTLVDAFGYTNYHSLQSQLTKRFSNGVQMYAAYTWSKTIGFCCNSDNNGGPRVKALGYLDLNRALMDFDRTHNLQFRGVFELPFGRGKRFDSQNGIVRAIASGWQINTLTSVMSGRPFSVTASSTSLRAPGNDQRADQVKPEVAKLGGIGRGNPYYDWTAFAPVTQARFGTAAFNSLRGPGHFSSDLGLFRRFMIGETRNLEFRAEAFNWTNTPKFGQPSGNISSLQTNSDGTYRTGVFEITGTESLGRDVAERMIRLGLRFEF